MRFLHWREHQQRREMLNDPTGGGLGNPEPTAQSAGRSGGGSDSSAAGFSGQVGISGGGNGAAQTATGLPPDQVAQFCKDWGDLYSTDQIALYVDFGYTVEALRKLKKEMPVQFDSNIEVLQGDYQALVDKTRIFSQVRDEIDNSHKPLSDFQKHICR
jgi:hypothetical protein